MPRLFLLALDAEHVRFTASGVTLSVHARSDETVPSRRVTLTRAAAAATCPVLALEEWLRASDTAFGPVFRKVDRWGNVEHGRLAPDAWHRILARRGRGALRGAPRRARSLMARSAAGKAAQAASALETFLRDWPSVTSIDREGSASLGAPAHGDPTEVSAPTRAGEGGSVKPASLRAGAPLRLPHTDWLRHRLMVSGPAAGVDAFRNAAAGAGTIPWRLELDTLQEDWFHRLVNPANRSLSLAGARVLAGQLREAVERRHALAVSRVGRSRACPLDLHALIPVPADILYLGPDHPDSVVWLWQHWGTTQALRHVAPDLPTRLASAPKPTAGEDTLRLVFWSADWTPWQAVARIRADWPGLCFDVQPDYATG